MLEVIKRDGKVQKFQALKIKRAIMKANETVSVLDQATMEEIDDIVNYIQNIELDRMHIEAIQNLVENSLMDLKHFELARKYITYRYTRNLGRQLTETEQSILGIIRGTNKDVIEENSNKNAFTASTQRDLMAGEVSKDITKKFILPEDISKAISLGWIHWHDMDYSAQPIFNCCLIDIYNMLTNGTVINNLLIESPRSFHIACTVVAQIIASIASNQYGGQSINIKHLGKYVAVSREKYMVRQAESFKKAGVSVTEEQLKAIVEDRVREEIKQGVQSLQYMINTLLTTNGRRFLFG